MIIASLLFTITNLHAMNDFKKPCHISKWIKKLIVVAFHEKEFPPKLNQVMPIIIIPSVSIEYHEEEQSDTSFLTISEPLDESTEHSSIDREHLADYDNLTSWSSLFNKENDSSDDYSSKTSSNQVAPINAWMVQHMNDTNVYDDYEYFSLWMDKP